MPQLQGGHDGRGLGRERFLLPVAHVEAEIKKSFIERARLALPGAAPIQQLRPFPQSTRSETAASPPQTPRARHQAAGLRERPLGVLPALMRLTYNARQELSMNIKLVALALLAGTGIAIAQTVAPAPPDPLARPAAPATTQAPDGVRNGATKEERDQHNETLVRPGSTNMPIPDSWK
jgi:hypothetical protein